MSTDAGPPASAGPGDEGAWMYALLAAGQCIAAAGSPRAKVLAEHDAYLAKAHYLGVDQEAATRIAEEVRAGLSRRGLSAAGVYRIALTRIDEGDQPA